MSVIIFGIMKWVMSVIMFELWNEGWVLLYLNYEMGYECYYVWINEWIEREEGKYIWKWENI